MQVQRPADAGGNVRGHDFAIDPDQTLPGAHRPLVILGIFDPMLKQIAIAD